MISYSKVDYTIVSANTDPAPQEGLTTFVKSSAVKTGPGTGVGEIVISKGGGKTPTGSVGNGLAAPQPIGLLPLRPCPADDCRDNGECFVFNVFGGSNNQDENDYNTFMLEYPFTGAIPYFNQNLSKWQLRKSYSGVMNVQETIDITSDICTFKNYVRDNYIYFFVRIWWDKVLTKYGTGVYDLFVTSTIDGAIATQCSDKFNLISICCDLGVPAPPAMDICDYGVKNGELVTPSGLPGMTCIDGWTLYGSDVGQYPLYYFADDMLYAYFTDLKINHYTIFNGTTCNPMVAGTPYSVTYEIELDPGTNFKVTLGTASGALRTQSGTYTEIITATGPVLELQFGTYNVPNNTPGFVAGQQFVAKLKYIRIPALSGMSIDPINIQNFDFSQLGQTFDAAAPMYQIPGWTDTNGSYLSFSQTALHFENYHPSYAGRLAIGHRTPIPAGYVGYLRGTTNPLLNAGDTYDVTIKIDSCDPEIAVSVGIGGTFGTAHSVAGTFTETLVCGTDGTGLTIAAEMLAQSNNWRPAFVNYVSIIKVAGGGTKVDLSACTDTANCTMQIKVKNGKSVFKYPNGERFDYRGNWIVNDMGTITTEIDPLFNDCLRLPGIFGYGESGEEKIDIRYNSGLVKNIRQEIIRRYTMKTDLLPYDVLERLEVFGRFAEEMLISDFNVINPDYSLKERSVKIEGDFKPDYDTSHNGRTRLVMLELGFVDRVRDIERRIC